MINGFRKTTCSITGTVHELVWGAVNDNKIWLGISGIKAEVDKLINQLEFDLPAKIGARFATTTWMDTDLPALLDDLEGVYTTYKTQTVTNPDPTGSGTIIPTYFSQLLGPSTTSGRELNVIYQE